jgi:hypothetical protein
MQDILYNSHDIQILTIWSLKMDRHRKLRWLPASSFLLLLCFGVAFSGRCAAQEELPSGAGEPVLQGYITATHLPDGFDVNGIHVALWEGTTVGYFGDTRLSGDSPQSAELHSGRYVAMTGQYDRATKTVKAERIYLRDEHKEERSGSGLILRVISSGPEPVYRADGYLVSVKSTAKIYFHSGLKELSNAGSGTILQYKGKLGKDGILVAQYASFTCAKHRPGSVSSSSGSGSPDSAALSTTLSSEDKQHTWKLIPQNDPQQQRIARIGMSLLPAYQREMANNNPDKLDLRFYVVDDEKIRNGYTLIDKHVILIPKQAAERLQNESQLAAVLAEGIAQKLQIAQGVKITDTGLAALGITASVAIFGAPIAAIGLAASIVPSKYKGEPVEESPVRKQRDRIALGLMADAGYDPHQAPEAWRLLANERPRPETQSMPYPTRSESQLNILAILYDPHTTPVTAGPQ